MDRNVAKEARAEAINNAKLKAEADRRRISRELKAAKNAADPDKQQTNQQAAEAKVEEAKAKEAEVSTPAFPVSVVIPPYPAPKQLYSFDGYINTICNNVKIHMAEAASESDKERILGISVGREFKMFCSNIVYEAILRIGDSLREIVECGKVRTISDKMVNDVLRQIHTMSGVSFETVRTKMDDSMRKFKELRLKKADEKKKAEKKNEDPVDPAASTEHGSAKSPGLVEYSE